MERFSAKEMEVLRKCYENAVVCGLIDTIFEQYLEEIPEDIAKEIILEAEMEEEEEE